ncbi:MAG: amidohydrolase family protein, partial [Pseudomonadota bacterium]
MSARRTIIAVAIALGGLWSCTGGDDRPAVDTILHGGTVFDGTGRPGAVMDVATRGDRIVAVGEDLRTRYRATEEIDVGGQVVAPGFIDPHTHAIEDVENLAEPQPLVHYLTQGVSTLVIGNDGRGGADVSRTLEKLEGLGVGPNVAVFVGHNALRIAAMGMVDRAPTAEELDQMTHDVDRAMAEGALGLSAGLYYTPGVYATTEEVTALARVAARYGGLYESHIRDESTYSIGLLEAIDEALTIGRDSGAAVHIAHIKALGVDVWGQSEAVVTRINDARDAGQSVTADQYPWRASGTRLTNALLPGWVRAGGTDAMVERLRDNTVWARLLDEMRENLRRRGGARAILLTSGEHAGHTLHDVAATRDETPVDTALALILAGDARIASFNMHEDDIARFMTQPWVVT